MSKKMYKVFAPNGKYVDIFLKGNIVHFKHGEIVEIEKEIAEQFSTIFYEIVKSKKPQEVSKEKSEDKVEKPQVNSKEKETKEKTDKKKNKKEK